MVMCARCEPHKLPGSVRHPFAQELPVAKLALWTGNIRAGGLRRAASSLSRGVVMSSPVAEGCDAIYGVLNLDFGDSLLKCQSVASGPKRSDQATLAPLGLLQ